MTHDLYATLTRLDMFATRYADAIGAADRPLRRDRLTEAMRIEWEIVGLWRRLPSDLDLIDTIADAAPGDAATVDELVRRASASLWRARGRLAKKLAFHPDVLAALRATLGRFKALIRQINPAEGHASVRAA